MQEPGSRPAPQFAGVDLRRPKGYPAPVAAKAEEAEATGGDPCPRCESRDTKFCYYNNYNTSQPRHFCKSCRRYWTKGGSLRNVPVGGGTRKSSSSSSSPAATKKSSKRRRVAPATDPPPVPMPGTDDAAANAAGVGSPGAPTTPVTTEEAAPTTVAAEGHAAATTAAAEGAGVFGDASVALGLGVTDVGSGKEMPFEWPSSCGDLGFFWGTAGVFADTTDPALFLNLP